MLALWCAAGVGVLAELGARRALRRWGRYYRYVPYWQELHAFDREMFANFPATARVAINSDGERGDPPPRPGERALRVLVVGGSAAECYCLDQDATWSAVAQRRLNAPQHLTALGVPHVHVGNASRAILTCADLGVMLGKILPRHERIDVLVLMLGGADVVTWVERGMPPTIAHAPVDIDKLFERHPEGPWGWRATETVLWRLAGDLHRRTRRPLVRRHDSLEWMRRARRMRAEAPHRIDELADPTAMLDHFESSLRSLIAVARTRVERIVLVRQPWFGPTPTPEEEAMFWNFGLGRPYREQVSTYLTPRAVDALMRLMDARSAAVAASEGLVQVDTIATLERSARTFYDELHLTPAGADAVGHLVAEGILASFRKHPLGSVRTASSRHGAAANAPMSAFDRLRPSRSVGGS